MYFVYVFRPGALLQYFFDCDLEKVWRMKADSTDSLPFGKSNEFPFLVVRPMVIMMCALGRIKNHHEHLEHVTAISPQYMRM